MNFQSMSNVFSDLAQNHAEAENKLAIKNAYDRGISWSRRMRGSSKNNHCLGILVGETQLVDAILART